MKSYKKIMVVSHERSGTHFLINSIAFNFPELVNSNVQIDVPPTTDYENLYKFFESYEGRNPGRIFKSHHQASCFNGLKEYLDEYQIFYIVRDGRDVMTSCWYYFNQVLGGFPKTKSVGELMRTVPFKYSFDKSYSVISKWSMIERWAEHIEGWMNKKEIIAFIKYENLINNFYETIHSFKIILPFPPMPKLRQPTINDRGIANRKGIVGDWKNHFTEEDELFFNQRARYIMRILGYA